MIFFKKATLLTGLLLLLANVSVQAQVRQTRGEYVEKYKQIAIEHMERYGIPASIIMAQGILESDCGNSWLSQASNNHFGIKCKSNWTGRAVYYDDDEQGECFRAYDSVEASYVDHAEFLDAQPRYDSLFRHAPDDYKSWARGLKAAGYATAPDYAQRLVRIIEEEQLYLLDHTDGASRYARRDGKSNNAWSAAQNGLEQATAAGVVDPDDYRVTVNAHKGYNVAYNNGVCYIQAKPDDTFEKIARDFRLSARNLRKFNEVAEHAQPVAGEVIYIGRKKKHRDGEPTQHVAKQGETFWSLGQYYGLRTRSIERLNKGITELKEGTTIKLR